MTLLFTYFNSLFWYTFKLTKRCDKVSQKITVDPRSITWTLKYHLICCIILVQRILEDYLSKLLKNCLKFFSFRKIFEIGIVMHTCNPATLRDRCRRNLRTTETIEQLIKTLPQKNKGYHVAQSDVHGFNLKYCMEE